MIGNGGELLYKFPSIVAICGFMHVIEDCRLVWIIFGLLPEGSFKRGQKRRSQVDMVSSYACLVFTVRSFVIRSLRIRVLGLKCLQRTAVPLRDGSFRFLCESCCDIVYLASRNMMF